MNPALDPETDIALCRSPTSLSVPGIPEGDGTQLFAHPVPGSTPLFYLSYQLHPSDPHVIRRFDTQTDAAAFILGLAGPKLAGIPEPDQCRIRKYFPGWFGAGDADKNRLAAWQNADPENPAHRCDAGHADSRRPEIPTGLSASMNPVDTQFPDLDALDCATVPPLDTGFLYSQTPAPDPASCAILFRSLRYSLQDGSLIEHGTDLLATRDPACFWFRHWTWDGGTWNDCCEFATRDMAVLFIRDQFTKQGLFSGWNHRGLHEYLPEVYGKK